MKRGTETVCLGSTCQRNVPPPSSHSLWVITVNHTV